MVNNLVNDQVLPLVKVRLHALTDDPETAKASVDEEKDDHSQEDGLHRLP